MKQKLRMHQDRGISEFWQTQLALHSPISHVTWVAGPVIGLDESLHRDFHLAIQECAWLLCQHRLCCLTSHNAFQTHGIEFWEKNSDSGMTVVLVIICGKTFHKLFVELRMLRKLIKEQILHHLSELVLFVAVREGYEQHCLLGNPLYLTSMQNWKRWSNLYKWEGMNMLWQLPCIHVIKRVHSRDESDFCRKWLDELDMRAQYEKKGERNAFISYGEFVKQLLQRILSSSTRVVQACIVLLALE